jgi:hypothetical protein
VKSPEQPTQNQNNNMTPFLIENLFVHIDFSVAVLNDAPLWLTQWSWVQFPSDAWFSLQEKERSGHRFGDPT